jgi:hypothetical protein
MRGEQHVGEIQQRTGGRKGFRVRHVQRGAAQVATRQRLHQRGLVHHRAARRVHQQGARLHGRELGSPQPVPGLGVEGHVQRDEVRLGQQRGLVHAREAQLHLQVRPGPAVDVQDSHAEAARPPRHRLSDGAQPHQPQRRPVHVRAQEQAGLPRPPVARAHVRVRLRHPPRQPHQQGEGEVRRRLREDPGRVPHRNAPCGTGRHVDVIVPHRHVAARPQGGGLGEQRFIHPVRQQGQQPVGLPGLGQQHLPRRRQLLLPHAE